MTSSLLKWENLGKVSNCCQENQLQKYSLCFYLSQPLFILLLAAPTAVEIWPCYFHFSVIQWTPMSLQIQLNSPSQSTRLCIIWLFVCFNFLESLAHYGEAKLLLIFKYFKLYPISRIVQMLLLAHAHQSLFSMFSLLSPSHNSDFCLNGTASVKPSLFYSF